MANSISRATRQRYAADISATDVARAKGYFRKRFDSWNDAPELIAESLGHYWREYCAARQRGDVHELASKRATFRAAAHVAEGARFARAVATQYVDAINPADWRRRKAIDDAAAVERLENWIANPPRAVDPWQRLRLELFAALGMIDAPESRSPAEALPAVEPNRERCGSPSDRVKLTRRSHRPVDCAPVASTSPAAPGRVYASLRLSRNAWNVDRLEQRLDNGEWLYVAATEYALAKAD